MGHLPARLRLCNTSSRTWRRLHRPRVELNVSCHRSASRHPRSSYCHSRRSHQARSTRPEPSVDATGTFQEHPSNISMLQYMTQTDSEYWNVRRHAETSRKWKMRPRQEGCGLAGQHIGRLIVPMLRFVVSSNRTRSCVAHGHASQSAWVLGSCFCMPSSCMPEHLPSPRVSRQQTPCRVHP